MRGVAGVPHVTAPPTDLEKPSEETADLVLLRKPLVAALLLLMCRGAASATAQSLTFPSPATVISQDGVNLRYLASTTSPSLQVLPFGTVVTIEGLPTSDNWYPIEFGAMYGWTLGDYLTAGALDPTTAAAAAPLTGSHVSGPTSSNASLHATPLLPPPAPSGQTPSLNSAPAGGPPPPPGQPAALNSGPSGGPPPPPPTPGGGPGSGSPTSAYQATATYYGVDDSAQPGQAMACGAAFDPSNAHAAATNDWPCGTKLHISYGAGKSVDVVVADHGAYPSHWIDLSYAGFAQLADHSLGEITVTVQLAQ